MYLCKFECVGECNIIIIEWQCRRLNINMSTIVFSNLHVRKLWTWQGRKTIIQSRSYPVFVFGRRDRQPHSNSLIYKMTNFYIFPNKVKMGKKSPEILVVSKPVFLQREKSQHFAELMTQVTFNRSYLSKI